MKALRVLAITVSIALVIFLIVGFDNAFALLRSRVAIGLALAPLFVLFLWCIYMGVKTQQPRIQERPHRNKKSV